MKKHLNILITSIGSTTAISVVKGLKDQKEFKVRIVGTDINEKTNIAGSNFCDKFYTVPLATDEKAYLLSLVKIIESESIDLLIPIHDIELEILAKNRNIIEDLTYLLLSSFKTILTCNDKVKAIQFFNSIGIPSPKTFLVEDYPDVLNQIAQLELKFPLISKPNKGVSSKDVYELLNEKDLFLINKVKDPIIQEKLKGVEYTIDVFCNGKNLIAAVPRIRLETRSGISYKGQTQKDEILINYAKRITESLEIKGPANIQCFKFNNEVKFFEINPRFSGGLPLTIAAGVNTPLLALKLFTGEKLEPIENFKICKMCRYWQEVFYYED